MGTPGVICKEVLPGDRLWQPLDKYSSCPSKETYRVSIGSPDYKFSCSHFVAFKGFRERLHGHNYTITLEVQGRVGPDGYVVDFGDLKKGVREFAKKLNESLLVPMNSDVLKIKNDPSSKNIEIITEDGAFYSIPRADCSLLPIVHSTAEELAQYCWHQLVRRDILALQLRDSIQWVDIGIGERPTQAAHYRRELPQCPEERKLFFAKPESDVLAVDRNIDEPEAGIRRCCGGHN